MRGRARLGMTLLRVENSATEGSRDGADQERRLNDRQAFLPDAQEAEDVARDDEYDPSSENAETGEGHIHAT